MAAFVHAHVVATQLKFAELGNDGELTADFAEVRKRVPRGAWVFADGERDELGGAHHGVDFYLAGRCFSPREHASYVVTAETDPAQSLTPTNTRIALVRTRDQ
jgi:hypothetical protein